MAREVYDLINQAHILALLARGQTGAAIRQREPTSERLDTS